MGSRKQPWLRWYTDVLHNPKVHRLGRGPEFWTWTMLLCAYRENGDCLPSIDDLAFSLRTPKNTLLKHIETIIRAGLLDRTTEGLKPHNWDERQFTSDTSKERTKQWRDRHKKRPSDVTGDAHVTSQARHQHRHSDAHVTAQDTESDTENRNTQYPRSERDPPHRGSLSPESRGSRTPRETKPDRPKVVWPKLGEGPE